MAKKPNENEEQQPATEAMSSGEIALHKRIDQLEELFHAIQQAFGNHQHDREGKVEVITPSPSEPVLSPENQSEGVKQPE